MDLYILNLQASPLQIAQHLFLIAALRVVLFLPRYQKGQAGYIPFQLSWRRKNH
jgi:hypothetical protein